MSSHQKRVAAQRKPAFVAPAGWAGEGTDHGGQPMPPRPVPTGLRQHGSRGLRGERKQKDRPHW